VDVCAILDLDRFLYIGDQTPELALDVVLGDRTVTVEDRVEWHLVLEVPLLEVVGLLLELLERVETALLESELAIAYKTPRAVPFRVRFEAKRRIQASTMIGVVARLADDQKARLAALAALFAFLRIVSILGRVNEKHADLLRQQGCSRLWSVGCAEPSVGRRTCASRPLSAPCRYLHLQVNALAGTVTNEI